MSCDCGVICEDYQAEQHVYVLLTLLESSQYCKNGNFQCFFREGTSVMLISRVGLIQNVISYLLYMVGKFNVVSIFLFN